MPVWMWKLQPGLESFTPWSAKRLRRPILWILSFPSLFSHLSTYFLSRRSIPNTCLLMLYYILICHSSKYNWFLKFFYRLGSWYNGNSFASTQLTWLLSHFIVSNYLPRNKGFAGVLREMNYGWITKIESFYVCAMQRSVIIYIYKFTTSHRYTCGLGQQYLSRL